MDQTILNATIAIEEVVDKGKKLSIKGNDGSRTYTYSVWKDKADGTPTAAHAQFVNMGLKVGSTVYIGYVVDEYTTQIGGFDKRIQSKKIINFRESQPTQTSSQVKSPVLGHSGASSEVLKDQTFWERQAYEKCCSLWAAQLLDGERSETVEMAIRFVESGAAYKMFQAIKADGAKRFSPLREAVNKHAPEVIEDLPIINVDDEDQPPF